MRVLLTGATGTIGSALLPLLVECGHDVTAAVRSAQSARAVSDAGAAAATIDFADGDRLRELMTGADGVVHLASDPDDPEGFDRRVATAAVDALGGSGTPYVHTGGAWVYGSGDAIEETDPVDPPAVTAWRVGVIEDLAAADLPLTVVHPGIVYGYGKGIAQGLADAPRTEDGRLTTVGSGEQHWTTIHVDDLAALYLAVLEAGSGFADVLGVGGDDPRVLDLSAAFAAGAGVATETAAAAAERLGAPMAEALLLDQRAAGDKARGIGGWTPTRPALIEEIAARR